MGRVGDQQQQQQQPGEQGDSHPRGRLSPRDALRDHKQPYLSGRVPPRHRHSIHTSAGTASQQSTQRGDVIAPQSPERSVLLIKTSHWDGVQRLDSPHVSPTPYFCWVCTHITLHCLEHLPLSHKKSPELKQSPSP